MQEISPSTTGHPGNNIPWIQRLKDHENKMDEYLQNCLFRGCNPETTIKSTKSALTSMFNRVDVEDPTHPNGHRHLLCWELLDPRIASTHISSVTISLLEDDLAPGTRCHYLRDLCCFIEYVVAKPNIPGTTVTVAERYGPIAMNFTKYDLPVHARDRPVRTRYALAPNLLNDVYEFLRTDHLPNHSLPHMGARNYTAIILQAEIGARNSELLGIRWGGETSDVDLLKKRVRLFGKGAAYSGKKLRWVPLTALAIAVLTAFQEVFKPMFPKSEQSDYLFLNEDGSRLTKRWYWEIFRNIIDQARDSGVQIPHDIRPHDLRRTCATNALEKNPLAYRKVLKNLGHSYPSSAAPYLIATDQDVEEGQNDLIDIFVDPSIEKWGKS